MWNNWKTGRDRAGDSTETHSTTHASTSQLPADASLTLRPYLNTGNAGEFGVCRAANQQLRAERYPDADFRVRGVTEFRHLAVIRANSDARLVA